MCVRNSGIKRRVATFSAEASPKRLRLGGVSPVSSMSIFTYSPGIFIQLIEDTLLARK
jgi:hypothetical protein